MRFSFSQRAEGTDLLVLPFWEGPRAAADFGALNLAMALKDFSGKGGETSLCYGEKGRILLLGLGKEEKVNAEVLRRAYASAVKAASSKKVKEIHVLFPKCKKKEEFLRGIAEGVILANYSFTYKEHSLKEAPIVLLEKCTFIGVEKSGLLQKLQTVGEEVCFVRNLVLGNADDKSARLISWVKKLHPRVKTTVFDKKKLEAEGLGLILAVNRASSLDPYLIQAEYRGNSKSKEHIVLVGKGITYDTGGLSLKTTDNMMTMKSDMSGAATVLGAVKTAAALGLKVNVTALAPVAENCMGPKAYKLGDVYRSYSGKTVEVNNTDAEGRLVLADAIAYAVDRLKPSCVVDLGTLTGSCVIALGEEIAGLFTKDEGLARDLIEASHYTGELLCRLPIYDDYKEALKSEIADLLNSGGREGGAIKAALFLQEFVGDVPWAHLDIAGPAYLSKSRHYYPMRGTGFGLRLLVEFLEGKAK